MNFMEIAQARQSCRSYDAARPVEQEKLDAMLAAARLAPSACNGQPYHFTVCRGEVAKEVEKAARGVAGLNKFATEAPVVIVVSEKPYVKTAAVGAKLKNNDYRSIDIGIAVAYLTAEAAAQGLGTCILGWLDDARIRQICGLDQPVRLLVTVGYPAEGDPLRKKVRKDLSELAKEM
ncbi:MAG: nitroreductase family protein [Oscillospiraceae bacterium]|nr:nitroreductase family protein [Oscillospiraceae bacterium]